MILITGSQGFIGSHLYDAIPKCIGLDKDFKGREQLYIKSNLLDYSQLFWDIKNYEIEYVLHNAAIPSVPASYDDPMKTYINNVNASVNLIKACKINKVKKIIFASSSSVMGDSPYGHSKKIIEEILDKSGLNYTILRYFNVVGPRQRENVASIMLKQILKDEPVTIFGDGSTTRDFSYVQNVVNANLKALNQKYDGQTLEVGTGISHSLLDLYRSIRQIVRPNHSGIIFKDTRVGDIKFSQAKTFLNKTEITSFNKGIEKWLSYELASLAPVSSAEP